MGKKRNNAAKKKQAAKKNKLSSAFGVTVQKGGTIARNNGVLESSSLADSSAQAKKQKGAPAANNDLANTNAALANSSNVESSNNGGKPSQKVHHENDEFNRLHASLEERSLALQARKKEQRRNKKERQKLQKKGWGKFAAPKKDKFAPATLNLAPKSTQELVDDAANQVAMGMNEIGQRTATNSALISSHVAPLPGQSSLAAAAGMNWKLQVSNVENNETTQQNQIKNNKFAALDWDSDNEMDGENSNTPQQSVPQFQFQPASFSFQSSFTVPSAVASGKQEDFDPDL